MVVSDRMSDLFRQTTMPIDGVNRAPSASAPSFPTISTARRLIEVKRRTDVYASAQSQAGVYILRTGWAYRYKDRRDGKRQIINIILPGEICNLDYILCGVGEYNVLSVESSIVEIVPIDYLKAELQRVGDEDALVQTFAAETYMVRELLCSISMNDALGKLAFVISEIFGRLEEYGLTNGSVMPCLIKQADFGEALGTTSVHINRMFRNLRELGLAHFKGLQISIDNIDGLRNLGGYRRPRNGASLRLPDMTCSS